MTHDKKGTLAVIVNHPLRRQAKINTTAEQMAQRLLLVNKQHDKRRPDSEAIRFYALNQLMQILSTKFSPNEPLPEWAVAVVEAYEKEIVEQHSRLVWYTFIVATREARHLKSKATTLKDKMFSAGFKAMLDKVQDHHEDVYLKQWLEICPPDDLGHYMDGLTHIFNKGSFGGGGYGGIPWGTISGLLAEYANGKINGETFIDQAYALAHNNGPMFNKELIYEHHTGYFLHMLDAQRSGQICEGVISGQFRDEWGIPVRGLAELKTLIEGVRANIPDCIGDYIDWHKVIKDGALHPGVCQAYAAKQDKKYGKKVFMKLKDGKPIKVLGTYEVYPGQTVEVYERLTGATA